MLFQQSSMKLRFSVDMCHPQSQLNVDFSAPPSWSVMGLYILRAVLEDSVQVVHRCAWRNISVMVPGTVLLAMGTKISISTVIFMYLFTFMHERVF